MAAVRARYQQLRRKIAEIQQYIESDIAMALRAARPLTADTGDRLAGLVQTMRNVKDLSAAATALLEKSQLVLQNATKTYRNASKSFEVCLPLPARILSVRDVPGLFPLFIVTYCGSLLHCFYRVFLCPSSFLPSSLPS